MVDFATGLFGAFIRFLLGTVFLGGLFVLGFLVLVRLLKKKFNIRAPGVNSATALAVMLAVAVAGMFYMDAYHGWEFRVFPFFLIISIGLSLIFGSVAFFVLTRKKFI